MQQWRKMKQEEEMESKNRETKLSEIKLNIEEEQEASSQNQQETLQIEQRKWWKKEEESSSTRHNGKQLQGS